MTLEEVKQALLTGVVSITYKNKEGMSVTDEKCTLKQDLLPTKCTTAGYTDNQKEAHDKLVTYYSLTKAGWRKLKPENYVSAVVKD